MYKNSLLKKRGFTLIELLVVMAILGILAVIGLGSFSSAQAKARDARRKSDLNGIAKALEVYYNDHGRYPIGETSTGRILGCADDFADPRVACDWEGSMRVGETTYMPELPKDPKGNYYYFSLPANNGASYVLFARLENTEDPAVPVLLSGQPGAYNSINTFQSFCRSSGLTKCNYVITSSNTTVDPSYHTADN